MIGSPWFDVLPPGAVLILGALVVPLLRGRIRAIYMLALPVIGFVQLLVMSRDAPLVIELFDYELSPVRVDRLSLLWGYIFHIAAFTGVIFALKVKEASEHVASLIYAGAAIGAVFAGDLITLFIFWEGTAIASVFLIWATRTERSYRAGMRYLVIQIGSGVLLLAGGPGPCLRDGVAGLQFHRAGRRRRHADLPGLRHQGRFPAAAQLAAGRLPGGHRFWNRVAERVHDQTRHLRTCERLPRDRAADRARDDHDAVPDLLRRNRERLPARLGL